VEEFTLIAQKHSEEDLQPFFNQWLLDWDVPDIRWSTRVEDSRVTIQFQQKQTSPYQMRIPVLVKSKNGDSIRLVAAISEKSQQVEFDGLPFTPSSVEIDPLHETLMKTGR
jgi:aminopeptidase N